ncbi:SH3 domain-containing protein [Trichonephila clavipes]|nr:SH3 domain-containing protein [Trichonephila clavipes]
MAFFLSPPPRQCVQNEKANHGKDKGLTISSAHGVGEREEIRFPFPSKVSLTITLKVVGAKRRDLIAFGFPENYLGVHREGRGDGQTVLQHNLEQWLEIVKTREYLPESIEKMFEGSNGSKIGSEYASSSIVISPMSCQNMSCNTSPTIGGMRKTQSIDSSYLDLRDYEDAPYPRPLSRAKSDFNLTSSSASLVSSDYTTGTTVSRQTVYRRLGHIGLYARRPVRCVPLTATHCRLRLTWSREHSLWTPQQLSCVMFSDESRLSLQSDSRRTLIWRAPGTR